MLLPVGDRSRLLLLADSRYSSDHFSGNLTATLFDFFSGKDTQVIDCLLRIKTLFFGHSFGPLGMVIHRIVLILFHLFRQLRRIIASASTLPLSALLALSSLPAITRIIRLICLLLLWRMHYLTKALIILHRAKRSVPAEIFRKLRSNSLRIAEIDIAIRFEITCKVMKKMFRFTAIGFIPKSQMVQSKMKGLMLQQRHHRRQILIFNEVWIIAESEHIARTTNTYRLGLLCRKSIHCRQQDTIIGLLHRKDCTNFLKVHYSSSK